MTDSHVRWAGKSGWALRALLALVLLLATLLSVGCSKPASLSGCKEITATVGYYYRYKDAMPDYSDIAYIELLPPSGSRCVVVSPKKAPIFPDEAVGDAVKNGLMKIDIPEAKTVQIQGKANVAVYYAGSASAPSHTPVAVEDLTGVSRVIETISVMDGSPSCGACPSIPCGRYACCKRPPCP
jgi:hypothetical protein